jgi:hypothetical protein
MAKQEHCFPEQTMIMESLTHVLSQKETLYTNIKRIIDGYWSWFNAENKNIAKLQKVGLTELDISNVAPVIESRKNGDIVTYYILWKNHQKKFRNNVKKSKGSSSSPSIRLHDYDSLKIKQVLRNKCKWDAPKAIALETRFEYMRVSLKGFHESEVRLRSAARKLESLSTKTTDTTLGEA